VPHPTLAFLALVAKLMGRVRS